LFVYLTQEETDEPSCSPAVRIPPLAKSDLAIFWRSDALFLVQILMGMFTAHYAVEGEGFMGSR